MSDEFDPLEQLVEILGPFRETIDKNIKTLYRKNDLLIDRLVELERTVWLQGILLWFILGSVIVGLLAFLAFLLTR